MGRYVNSVDEGQNTRWSYLLGYGLSRGQFLSQHRVVVIICGHVRESAFIRKHSASGLGLSINPQSALSHELGKFRPWLYASFVSVCSFNVFVSHPEVKIWLDDALSGLS